jgi:EpsI family protein
MRIGGAAALALLALLALGGTGWVRHAEGLEAALPRQVFLPEMPGWRRVDYAPNAWWEPRAAGAEHRLLGRYADGQGHEVDVFFALYAAQRPGKKAAATGEGAFAPDRGWSWHSPGPPLADARSDRLLGAARTERLAETYYRTGGLTTGSAARLSLATMQDHVLLRARPTMLTILSAEERPGKPAAAALSAFRKSTGPPGPWMDRIAGLR